METQEGQRRPSLRDRIGQAVRELRKGLIPVPEKIKPEEIDDQKVAKTIYWQLRNTFRQDQRANGFTIVDLLANMGFVGFWSDTDYRQKFPEAYQRTRAVLQKLVDQEMISMSPQPADLNEEILWYRVVNEDSLRELAHEKSGKK